MPGMRSASLLLLQGLRAYCSYVCTLRAPKMTTSRTSVQIRSLNMTRSFHELFHCNPASARRRHTQKADFKSPAPNPNPRDSHILGAINSNPFAAVNITYLANGVGPLGFSNFFWYRNLLSNPCVPTASHRKSPQTKRLVRVPG